MNPHGLLDAAFKAPVRGTAEAAGVMASIGRESLMSRKTMRIIRAAMGAEAVMAALDGFM
jgi:hypothetical protein